MTGSALRLTPRFWVGLALVVVNVVLLSCILGSWAVVSQHERLLDEDTITSCTWNAVAEATWSATTSGVHVVADNTIEFELDPDKGPSRAIRCTLSAEGDTYDDPLTVVSAEVVR